MKRGFTFVLAIMLLLVSVAPALAQGSDGAGSRVTYRFQLSGEVMSVDVATGILVVSVTSYTPRQPTASARIEIRTTNETQFRYNRNDPASAARRLSIEDVRIGDKITANGLFRNGVHWGLLILLPFPDNSFSLRGRVTDVDPDAGTIEVDVLSYLPDATPAPTSLTLYTTDETIFCFHRAEISTADHRPGIGDVRVGDEIAARGIVEDNKHIAKMIILPFPDNGFSLKGRVTAINGTAIDVEVLAYFPVTSPPPTTLTVYTTDATIFRYYLPRIAPADQPPTIEDIQVGDEILVRGKVEAGRHVADLVLIPFKDNTFNLTGRVLSINSAAGAFTVEIITYMPPSLLPVVPPPLVIQTTRSTIYRYYGPGVTPGPSTPTFQDIRVGDVVMVRGIVRTDRVHVAELVQLPFPSTPQPFSLLGHVTAVDLRARTITVNVLIYIPAGPDVPKTLTIQTTDATVFRYHAPRAGAKPPTLEDVKVGDTIAVRGLIREGVHVAETVLLNAPANAAELL